MIVIKNTPTYFETNYIRIALSEKGNFIVENWLDFAEDEEVKHAKMRELEMLIETKSCGYIADMRGFKGVSPEMKEWMETVWLPAMYENGCRFIPMIFSPDEFANFSLSWIMNDMMSKFEIEKFPSQEDAENWFVEKIKQQK